MLLLPLQPNYCSYPLSLSPSLPPSLYVSLFLPNCVYHLNRTEAIVQSRKNNFARSSIDLLLYIGLKGSWCLVLKLLFKWVKPDLFCLFLFFSQDKHSTHLKLNDESVDCFALDSNLGWQDGRRRRIHCASTFEMTIPQIIRCIMDNSQLL